MAWHEGERTTLDVDGVIVTIQRAHRFLTDMCEEGKHEECGKTSLMGLCGCPCHDGADGSS